MKIFRLPSTRRGKLIFTLVNIVLVLIISAAVYYTVTLFTKAQSCFTMSQIQSDTRCLYIYKTSVYEKGTRSAPHHDTPCGTDVTAKIPDSHLLDKVGHLDPNYKGEVCANAPQPTTAPTEAPTATTAPTNPPAPTATSVPQPTATTAPASTSTPNPQPTATPTTPPRVSNLPQTGPSTTPVQQVNTLPTSSVVARMPLSTSPSPSALPVAGNEHVIIHAAAVSALFIAVGVLSLLL